MHQLRQTSYGALQVQHRCELPCWFRSSLLQRLSIRQGFVSVQAMLAAFPDASSVDSEQLHRFAQGYQVKHLMISVR